MIPYSTELFYQHFKDTKRLMIVFDESQELDQMHVMNVSSSRPSVDNGHIPLTELCSYFGLSISQQEQIFHKRSSSTAFDPKLLAKVLGKTVAYYCWDDISKKTASHMFTYKPS